MKKFKEPFLSFWTGKHKLEITERATDLYDDYNGDEKYRTLKEAIKREAIRKWKR